MKHSLPWTPKALIKRMTRMMGKKYRGPRKEEEVSTLSELLDISPNAITIHDFDGNFLYANRKTFEIHGYDDPDEFMALNLRDLDVPESADRIQERMRLIGEKGEAFFEVSHFRKDGSAFPLDVYVKEATWRGVPALFSVATDITKRKRNEEMSRLRERHFKNILDTTQEGFGIFSENGRILEVNDAICRMLGYDKAEMIGMHISEILADEDPEVTSERIRSIRSGRSEMFESVHRRKDGGFLHVEISMNYTDAFDGQFFCFCRDITERKKTSHALRIQHELALALAQTTDLTDTLKRVLSSAIRISGMECGGIYLLDGKDGFLRMTWQEGLSEEFVSKVALLGPDSPNVRLVGKGLPVYARHNGITSDPERLREGLRGMAVIPILHQGRAVACINIASRKRDDVDSTVRSLLETIAAQSGAFIARAIIYKQLQESEQNYRTLVEGLPDIVMRYDRQGRHLFVSENVQDIVDIPAERFIGRTHRELGFSEDQCRFWEEVIQNVFRDRKAHETEFTLQGKNGPAIINWRLFPEFNEHGYVTSILSISRDITEHRQAESEIRKFKAIFDNANFGAAIADVDGMLAYVNAYFAAIHGYQPQDLLGKHLKILHPDDQMDNVNQVLRDAKLKGSMEAQEIWHCRRDGSRFPMLMSGSFVLDPMDARQYYATTAIDLTEIKELETQLQQSRKLEAIGHLAGGIAHDFNNMLSVILGRTNILLEDANPDARLRLSLEAIQHAAERSAALTRQLLGFARKQIIFPQKTDLNIVVNNMVRMLRRIVGEDIELVWKPGEALWPIRIDPSQVDQILVNIAANARDAIPGVGNVFIETANVEIDEEHSSNHVGVFPGDYVMLTVSDNGCGMDREIRDRIFEPFFTTKEIGKGTGMGLPTVYGIMQQNKGFIHVYSEPGQGTTFRMYFPRHLGGEDPVSEETPVEILPTEWETVLLVEDDPAILDLCRMMLTHLGHKVLCAATPAEAIRISEEYQGDIHLLMSDVVMPVMNGPDLARRILPLRPDIRCLFMSGYSADIIANKGLLDDDMGFIQKPFTRKELDVKIRALFKNR